MHINKIKISGFKSIADIELNDLTPYSVFAGANGAGKSNFFDALKFMSTVVSLGATHALSQLGGYENIHCFKHDKNKAKIFSSEINFKFYDEPVIYDLNVHDMDDQPKLDEKLILMGETLIKREKGKAFKINIDSESQDYPYFPDQLSSLTLRPNKELFSYFNNIKVYRFDHLVAKNSSGVNTRELDKNGGNIATMLSVLEENTKIREQIIEWMELLVPSLENISIERTHLDAQTVIRFKEIGVDKKFPAHLISDGTIYALCIMTAILGRSKKPGMTLIEEPERGIHPQAIGELINLMREHATPEHPIFITTHSESVIRHSKPEELWLVNKIEGKTEFKNAAKEFSDLGDLNLDTAWLMNMFDGGLPW